MTSTARKLLADVLALPEDERLELVTAVIASVDGDVEPDAVAALLEAIQSLPKRRQSLPERHAAIAERVARVHASKHADALSLDEVERSLRREP